MKASKKSKLMKISTIAMFVCFLSFFGRLQAQELITGAFYDDQWEVSHSESYLSKLERRKMLLSGAVCDLSNLPSEEYSAYHHVRFEKSISFDIYLKKDISAEFMDFDKSMEDVAPLYSVRIPTNKGTSFSYSLMRGSTDTDLFFVRFSGDDRGDDFAVSIPKDSVIIFYGRSDLPDHVDISLGEGLFMLYGTFHGVFLYQKIRSGGVGFLSLFDFFIYDLLLFFILISSGYRNFNL